MYLSSGLSHIYPWIECQLQSLTIWGTLIEMDMVVGGIGGGEPDQPTISVKATLYQDEVI